MSKYHGTLALVAAVLSVAAWASDARPVHNISATDLAERIIRGDPNLQVIDLRPAADFAQFHIPGARRMTIEELSAQAEGPLCATKKLTRSSLPRETAIVLYSDGGAPPRVGRYRNALFLRGGIGEWISSVMEPRLAADATAAERAEFERAAQMSRFFGGVPKADVPRSEAANQSTKEKIAGIRRRGC